MKFEGLTLDAERTGLTVNVLPQRHGPGNGRNDIELCIGSGGGAIFLDENHAEALEMALRAARLEVQARAVSR